MKAMETTRRTLWIFVLTCAVLLGWSVLVRGDFYVIPVVKEVSPANTASVPKTGLTECYTSEAPWVTCVCGTENCPPGQDGDLERGVNWPNPRFTDSGDGTVTDNLTGLIWTMDADCAGQNIWKEALDYCNALAHGTCGLEDGSVAGDWRLPNVRELQSLIHYAYIDPAVPNTAGTARWVEGDPFTNQGSGIYWSSSTRVDTISNAWRVAFYYGSVESASKANTYHFRCVR